MSETKPTSGDATLDALVRDLSAKVKATDGRWVAENEPKEGAKSIYDDFEGAIADAPRIDSHPDDARHAADALEERRPLGQQLLAAGGAAQRAAGGREGGGGR